jgi:hypothetical protein
LITGNIEAEEDVILIIRPSECVAALLQRKGKNGGDKLYIESKGNSCKYNAFGIAP